MCRAKTGVCTEAGYIFNLHGAGEGHCLAGSCRCIWNGNSTYSCITVMGATVFLLPHKAFTCALYAAPLHMCLSMGWPGLPYSTAAEFQQQHLRGDTKGQTLVF